MTDINSEILKKLDRIEPFPAVNAKLIELLNNPESETGEIVRVLNMDESLTAKVIKLANSPVFGGLRKLSSIEEAVVSIGRNSIINFAVSDSFGDIQSSGRGYDYKKGELWKHSLATAMASQRLVEVTGFPQKNLLFTTAVLHDIGKTFLDEYIKDKRKEIRGALSRSGTTLTSAEIDVLGCSHPQIGGMVLEKWNFPEEISKAVRFHHEPQNVPGSKDLTYHIYLSDIICMMVGFGLDIGGLSYSARQEVFDMYDINETQLQGIFAGLLDDIHDIEKWLNVSFDYD